MESHGLKKGGEYFIHYGKHIYISDALYDGLMVFPSVEQSWVITQLPSGDRDEISGLYAYGPAASETLCGY